MRRVLSRMLFGCFAFFLCTGLVFAQTDTAKLQGTVTDPKDAVVASATVTVTNVDTGRAVTAQTNAEGFYVVPALPAANYKVEVKVTGFKTVTRDLTLQISQVAVVDFRLEVGAVTESVTVSAGAPVIDAADSAIGEVIQGRQVTELPLNGRNFSQLATLVPGVTRGIPTGQSTGFNNNAETFRYGDSGGASLAVNGLRPQANNFTLDGIDNNESLVNTIIFFPPADSIQEFRVQTSVAPSEYGRAGGAVVATSLKSGTNDYHGSVFWFHRDQDLDARNFFDTGATKPGFSRNQFGVSGGGPILKNRLFFFGDYQGLRLKQPRESEVATVPTDLMRNGNFSELTNPAVDTGYSGPITIIDPTTGSPFSGNMIPTNRINPIGQNYLKAFPEPNCNVSIDSRCHDVFHNYRNSRKLIENWNDFDVRVDYNFDQDNQFFGRVSRGRASQNLTTRLATLPSGFGSGSNFNHPYGASLGWTRILSPRLINEMRYGFVRTYFGFAPPDQDVPICTQLGIPNCNTSPLLGGIALIGGFNNQIEYSGDFGPFLVPQTGFHFNDSLSWIRGNHTLKFGASLIRRQLNLFRPNRGKGFFFLWGDGKGSSPTHFEISDLLAGFVNQYTIGPPFGMVGTRSWENGFFAQDDWRVTPRLTLNLGIRYDVLTWPIEVQNRQANFDLNSRRLIVAGEGGASRSLIPSDWNNFAPRLGFAYQLTRDGKTVLRGGYGLFYFIDRGGVDNQLAQNPPFSGFAAFNFTDGVRIALSGRAPDGSNNSMLATGPLPLGLLTNLNLNNPTNVTVFAAKPSNVIPNVSQWNLQVQRQIDNNTSVSLGYVGTHGNNLTTYYNENRQLYGIAASDPNASLFKSQNLGAVNVQDTRGKSDYHSLQAQGERRLTNGWQFLGAFTWQKALDDSCGAFDCRQPQNFNNFRLEHGLSELDQKYRLVLSSLYELPFGRGKRWGSTWNRAVDAGLGGWQLNGIYTIQAGLPFDLKDTVAQPDDTRPDLVGSPRVNPGNISNYIDKSAFAAPPSTTFPDGSTIFDRPGTAGRNILRGPGYSNLDFALFKNFSVTERIKTQFRAQFYNISNTPHFQQPEGNLNNGSFGRINNTLANSNRQVELALRVLF